jgi:hypothetical protein
VSGPPGFAPAPEPRVEQISAARDQLATRTQQMRFLVAELGVTRPQAHRLIKAYEADLRDARRRDAREATREEFRAWFDRRGDLLVVRSKIKRGWAVTS